MRSGNGELAEMSSKDKANANVFYLLQRERKREGDRKQHLKRDSIYTRYIRKQRACESAFGKIQRSDHKSSRVWISIWFRFLLHSLRQLLSLLAIEHNKFELMWMSEETVTSIHFGTVCVVCVYPFQTFVAFSFSIQSSFLMHLFLNKD